MEDYGNSNSPEPEEWLEKKTVAHNIANTRPEWMDLKALTCYADVSERTLREWIHRAIDPLPASQVEAKILVKRSTFDRWMEMHPVKPADSIDVQVLVGDVLAELAVKN